MWTMKRKRSRDDGFEETMSMLRREKLVVVRRNNRNTINPSDFEDDSPEQLRLQQDLDMVETEMRDLRAQMEEGAQQEEEARETQLIAVQKVSEIELHLVHYETHAGTHPNEIAVLRDILRTRREHVWLTEHADDMSEEQNTRYRAAKELYSTEWCKKKS